MTLDSYKQVRHYDNVLSVSSKMVESGADVVDATLAGLYQYWATIRDRNQSVEICGIDPIDIATMGMMGYLHVVNVASENQDYFCFDTYGVGMPLEKGHDFTGRPIISHPVPRFGHAFLSEYQYVKSMRTPEYSECHRIVAGEECTYQRLLLPVFARNGSVDRLLVGIQIANSGTASDLA